MVSPGLKVLLEGGELLLEGLNVRGVFEEEDLALVSMLHEAENVRWNVQCRKRP